ncbi:hypothetical protein [Bradyrhizobium sp. BR 1432]|uniref:hypothetical protein n=1 Tax=Bradyrhizobium sp. BR 1432 TaxID=3447966 RepID=UPI003EE7901D
MQHRSKPLSVLLTLPLVLAHYFQFGLRAADILVSPFQVDDHRLLLGQPPLSFDDTALQLPQLIEESSLNMSKRNQGQKEKRPQHNPKAGAVGGLA